MRRLTSRSFASIVGAAAASLALAACSDGGANGSGSASGPSGQFTQVESIEVESSGATSSEATSFEATSSGSASPEAAPATPPAAPPYELVDPAPFQDPHHDGIYSFDTPIAGVNYFCYLTADSVGCAATAPDDVPNLEDMPGEPWRPFTGRPGGVVLDSSGTYTWGVIEGMPTTGATLQPGQRLKSGNAWCQVPDGDTIECGAGDEAFSVTGPGRTFTAL